MTTAQAKPAEDAFRIALSEMILWLGDDYGMEKGEAFMFLAQCLEARVTQFRQPVVFLHSQGQQEVPGLGHSPLLGAAPSVP